MNNKFIALPFLMIAAMPVTANEKNPFADRSFVSGINWDGFYDGRPLTSRKSNITVNFNDENGESSFVINGNKLTYRSAIDKTTDKKIISVFSEGKNEKFCSEVVNYHREKFGEVRNVYDNSFYIGKSWPKISRINYQWKVGNTDLTLKCFSMGTEMHMIIGKFADDRYLKSENTKKTISCKIKYFNENHTFDLDPFTIVIIPEENVVTNTEGVMLSKLIVDGNFYRFTMGDSSAKFVNDINRTDGGLSGKGIIKVGKNEIAYSTSGVCNKVGDGNTLF